MQEKVVKREQVFIRIASCFPIADITGNLRVLNARVNNELGSQVWQQIRRLPVNTRIRINLEGF